MADSFLSKWTGPSAATTGTMAGESTRDSTLTAKSEHQYQPLGHHSFVTRDTEVKVSTRPVETDINNFLAEIQISSEGIKSQTPPISEVPEERLMVLLIS